jgi:hypothetical protein
LPASRVLLSTYCFVGPLTSDFEPRTKFRLAARRRASDGLKLTIKKSPIKGAFLETLFLSSMTWIIAEVE